MTKKAKPSVKGGRPSSYKKRYADEMIKFFSTEPYKKETIEFSKEFFANGAIKKENAKYKLVPNKLPTFFGFAREIGVDKKTILNWIKARSGAKPKDLKEGEKDPRPLIYPEFFHAYNAAKDLQKEFLMGIGLAGAAPPAAYIFTAKNITDMRDKVDHGMTDSEGKDTGGYILLPTRIKPEYNKPDGEKPEEKEETKHGSTLPKVLEG